MKHIAREKLAEFVRDTLPTMQREAVQQHLHSCASCSQVVGLYRHVISVGSRETSYTPPEGAVRSVKACFGTRKAATGRSRSGFEMLFDSLAQPATAGIRASMVPTRQLLYRVGSAYVDVKIDREIRSGRALLLGQMLEGTEAGRPISGVPIILLKRGRSIARTSSNRNGEFQLDFEMKNDLELALAINRAKPVYLQITGAPIKRSTVRRGRKRKLNGSAAQAQ
jgi:hypothetical protein